jgi:hypothetical protein
MDLSSDSESDVVSLCSETEPITTLNDIQDMIKDYEKDLKRERKLNYNADKKKPEIVMDIEDFKEIKLTKTQVKQLQAKEKARLKQQVAEQKKLDDLEKYKIREAKFKARAELIDKKEEARKRVDVRSDKTKEGIVMKVNNEVKKQRGRPKQAPVTEETNIDTFQAKKPKLNEDEDPKLKEIEMKQKQLEKLDSMMNSNPYFAMIMKHRVNK